MFGIKGCEKEYMNLLEIDVYIYSGFPKWDLERRGNEIAIFSYIAEERKFALFLLRRGRERVHHRRRSKRKKEQVGKEAEGNTSRRGRWIFARIDLTSKMVREGIQGRKADKEEYEDEGTRAWKTKP